MHQVIELDDWVYERAKILYNEFLTRPFTLSEAKEALERNEAGISNISELLNILKDKEYLVAEKDPRDLRKTIYCFIREPKKKLILQGFIFTKPTNGNSLSRDKLFRVLKQGADIIRTMVDYRVLLLFLFYKAISDKWEWKVKEIAKKEGIALEDAYYVANEYFKLYDEEQDVLLTWTNIVKQKDRLTSLVNALYRISDLNREGLRAELRSLVERTGLSSVIDRRDTSEILSNLIDLFNTLDFTNLDYDVIGDAYQWILLLDAPYRSKAGEIYTPKEVVQLIVRLLDIEDQNSVLDPAMGSGGMLIEAYKYVKEKKQGKEPLLDFIGQERNEAMAVLGEMNLILHGITDAIIYIGDSLTGPRFPKADYILTNPPWNLPGYDEKTLSKYPEIKKIYNTYATRGYPSAQSADWAWIQLILYYTNKRAGIVLDNGALFRGGREKQIRKQIIEKDLIETIILLPEKLFYNTGAPGIIMILNKNKPPERRNKILFINASNEYEPHPEVKKLNRLGKQHIQKIVETHMLYKEIPGFSKIATLQEIKENDYNLNVTLYATPLLETEEVDIEKEYKELQQIIKETQAIQNKALQYIQQIIKTNKR